MGTFSELIESDTAGIFTMDGDDATFTPAGGVPVSCHVFVTKSVMLQPAGVETQVWQRGTTIEALVSELGGEPDRGDVFTVGSATYTVQAILENDGLVVKAVVT